MKTTWERVDKDWYQKTFINAQGKPVITYHYKRKSAPAAFCFEQEGIVNEYKAYGTVEKEWRYLNFFEHECYLYARVPRIKTPDNKVHIIMPHWSGLQNGFTLLFEALILQLSKGMPVV